MDAHGFPWTELLKDGNFALFLMISQNMPDTEQLPNEYLLIEEINAESLTFLWVQMQGWWD